MLTDEQWDIMRAIWSRRLRHALTTTRVNQDIAEASVKKLYTALNRAVPEIHWYEGSYTLPRQFAGRTPIRLVHNLLLYGVWYKIPEIERVVALMGYDPAAGIFRIVSNKPLVYAFRVRREHGGQFPSRPPWSRDLNNMFSQFDAPFVALYEFARAAKLPLDRELIALGDAAIELLDSTFAAVLFEGSVLLFDRPLHMGFDPSNLLSSTNGPAFEPDCGESIYAVNGVILPAPKRTPNWRQLSVEITNPQQRAAVIEYMGWERFFSMVPRSAKTKLDTDSHFGELYEVWCGRQEFTLLVVVNSTPEPDGSRKKFVIPVDHNCRPLPNAADPMGVMGAPQARTALNAVASTFGYTGEYYRAILGAES